VEAINRLRDRLPLMVGIAAILAGLVLGLLFQWTRAQAVGPSIPQDEYVVIVSSLYQSESNLALARERLARLSQVDFAKLVGKQADTYATSPKLAREARNLRNLANDLAAGKPVTTVQPGETGRPAGTASGGQKEQGNGGQWWITAILAALLIAGVSPFVVRITGPMLRPAWSAARRSAKGMSLDLPKPVAQREPSQPPAQRAGGLLEGISRMVSGRPGGASARPGARGPSAGPFLCSYRFGQDPYQEIHTISGGGSDELLGACGVNANLKFDGEGPPRYYAFTVWIHDHRGTAQLKSVAVVTRQAYADQPATLREWLGMQVFERMLPAVRGATAILETPGLRARVGLLQVEYEALSDGSAYIKRLDLKFDIAMKSTPQPHPVVDTPRPSDTRWPKPPSLS